MLRNQLQNLRTITSHNLPNNLSPLVQQEEWLAFWLGRRAVFLLKLGDMSDVDAENGGSHFPIFGVYGERFERGFELGTGTVPGMGEE